MIFSSTVRGRSPIVLTSAAMSVVAIFAVHCTVRSQPATPAFEVVSVKPARAGIGGMKSAAPDTEPVPAIWRTPGGVDKLGPTIAINAAPGFAVEHGEAGRP